MTFDSAKPPALYVDESQGDPSSPNLSLSLILLPRLRRGGSGGGGKGRFIQNKHSKRGEMEEAKGGGGVRLYHDFFLKKHPLSLGRRDDLNAKEIEINDDLVSPSDEDGAIFLHVLYMRLYCLYVTESKVKFLTGQTHFLTSTLLSSPLLSSTLTRFKRDLH